MEAYWHDRRIAYTGDQMAPQWAYSKFDLVGDCIVGFQGPCNVRRNKILDLEDLKARSPIRGPRMLHWIVEHFDKDMQRAVLRQRLLAALVRDEIEARAKRRLRRIGDDLYDGDRKLSISIAAPTPVSCKIHFAVNVVRASGVGVPTEGISAYDIDPEGLGKSVLKAYVRELNSADEARFKARGFE